MLRSAFMNLIAHKPIIKRHRFANAAFLRYLLRSESSTQYTSLWPARPLNVVWPWSQYPATSGLPCLAACAMASFVGASAVVRFGHVTANADRKKEQKNYQWKGRDNTGVNQHPITLALRRQERLDRKTVLGMALVDHQTKTVYQRTLFLN